MIPLLLILLTILIFWVGNVVIKRRNILKYANTFGTAPRHAIFGHLPLLASLNPSGIFYALMSFHEKYGKNLIHWGVLNDHLLILSDPESVGTILSSSKLIDKSWDYKFMSRWLGDGLLVSAGKKWHSRRKIITPTFHFKILEQFIRIFNKQSKVMVEKLQESAQTGQEVNIYNYTTLCALDVICEASMGVEIHAQEKPNSEYVQAVKQMSTIVFKRFFSVIREYPWIYPFTPTFREEKKALKVVHGFSDKVIRMRRDKWLNEKPEVVDEEKGKCFLDILLHATIDGKPLTNSDIREEVDTFMFEGHDTTTSGIAFTLYHLANHPNIQDRVYQEIVDVLGTKDKSANFDYRVLQELKYLEMVIKESLRITPPVPFMGRELSEDTMIQGAKLPRGMQVNIGVYRMQNDADLFPEPEKFDPERFSLENCQGRHPYAYVPFSAGNRNCIGQKFAMLELKSTVAQMVLNFKLMPTNKELVLQSDLILKSSNGVNVRLGNR